MTNWMKLGLIGGAIIIGAIFILPAIGNALGATTGKIAGGGTSGAAGDTGGAAGTGEDKISDVINNYYTTYESAGAGKEVSQTLEQFDINKPTTEIDVARAATQAAGEAYRAEPSKVGFMVAGSSGILATAAKPTGLEKAAAQGITPVQYIQSLNKSTSGSGSGKEKSGVLSSSPVGRTITPAESKAMMKAPVGTKLW